MPHPHNTPFLGHQDGTRCPHGLQHGRPCAKRGKTITEGIMYESIYKFPGSSASKESACNVGDPSSIPGSARSPGKGTGYPLQYSWASLTAQTVKTHLQLGDLGLIPGWGRSPRGRHGNPLPRSCLENSQGQRTLAGYSPWGCKESDTTETLNTSTYDPTQNTQIHKDRKGSRVPGTVGREQGPAANGHRVSLQGDRNVLELVVIAAKGRGKY